MVVIRTVVRPAVIAVGALVVGITFVGRVPSSSWIVELCASLRLHAALATFALLLLALVLRARVIAIGLVAALVLGVPPLASTIGWSPPTADGGEVLRVGHVQLQEAPLDLDAVVAEIRARDTDAFVLLAVAPADAATLPARVDDLLFTVTTLPERGEAVVLVTDRDRLRPAGTPRPFGRDGIQVTLRLAAGGVVDLLAVHPPSPRSPATTDRRNDVFTAMAAWARDSAHAHVVLGDLNATPFSHAFRRLRSDGDLGDSAGGRGWQPTWPAGAGILGLPIDHVLHSDELRAIGRHTGPTFGSEHRSLWVELEFG